MPFQYILLFSVSVVYFCCCLFACFCLRPNTGSLLDCKKILLWFLLSFFFLKYKRKIFEWSTKSITSSWILALNNWSSYSSVETRTGEPKLLF